MQLLSFMDRSWSFLVSYSSIRRGLTSEPVTSGSYSGRRVVTGLRVRLYSSPSSCSPGQADSEKESQILLSEKLEQGQWSRLDWRLLNTSIHQVNCPRLLLGHAKLASSAQSVLWQLPWIRERTALFFLPFLTYSAQARHKNWLQKHTKFVTFPGALRLNHRFLGQISSPLKMMKISSDEIESVMGLALKEIMYL